MKKTLSILTIIIMALCACSSVALLAYVITAKPATLTTLISGQPTSIIAAYVPPALTPLPTLASIPTKTLTPTLPVVSTSTLNPTNTSQPEIPITSLLIPTELLRSLALSYLNTEMLCGEKDIQSIDYQDGTNPNLITSITAEQSTTKAWDGTLLGTVPCNADTLREVSLQIYLHKWSDTTDMNAVTDMIAAKYSSYSKSRLPEIISTSPVKLPQDSVMLRFVDGYDGGAPVAMILITHEGNVTIVGVLRYPLMYNKFKLEELLGGWVIGQYKILADAGY